MTGKSLLFLHIFVAVTTQILWGSSEALATSIKATAVGSPNPSPILPNPDAGIVTLQNGDFQIRWNGRLDNPIGDGADETTNWVFDFSNDSNLEAFPFSQPLSSALLTLTLMPKNAGVITDSIGIFTNQPRIRIPELTDIPAVGTTDTISIELLDFEAFTSEQFTNLLTPENYTIPWFYAEDSLVSFAELELTAKSVPEPHSLLGLFISGAVAIAPLMKVKKSIDQASS